MPYKWLLFDADNTLMDFDKAAKHAMQLTFEHHNLFMTEDNYKVYKGVNHQVWAEFEKGEIDAVRLRSKRFELLFDWLNIKSADPMEFNQHYLEQLSLHNGPYDGVEDLLHELKEEYKISIITNGLKEVQRPNYNRRGWHEIFDSIIVSDEIGVQKPAHGFFEHAWKSIDHEFDKSQALVIGDNVHSDIAGGINYGLDTCWISRGRNNKTDIAPSYILDQVLELPKILKNRSGGKF